jgi:hypothetical protein
METHGLGTETNLNILRIITYLKLEHATQCNI